jgi:hypothetical protein
MSNTSGYIGLAVIGGVVAALIAGGMYYASGDNKLTPTGMSSYGQVHQGNFTPHFGGRKTHRRKKHGRKSRKH